MRNHLKSEIKSIHAYIPQHVITNKDLEILTGVNSLKRQISPKVQLT
jgi:hypothetical protein